MEQSTSDDAIDTKQKRIANRLARATKLAQSGKLKQAAEVLQTALKTAPDDPDLLHIHGLVLHRMGKSERAMASIRKSLRILPDNPHALNNLGNLLKLDDDLAGAEDAYRKALRVDPVNAQCLNNLGTVLRAQGKQDDAIATLREAVGIDPGLAEAHFNLAKLHFQRGEFWDALNAYRDCFRLGGDWADPAFYAKVMIATGNEREAEEMLADFLKVHPDHESARLQLAAMRGETPERASDAYVTEHFDKFAESFDGVLKNLDYRAPELVTDMVKARYGDPAETLDILDLGCGTGLCGPLIAPFKRKLVGIDLSSQMLRRAEKLGCYDRLEKAELQQYLLKQPPESLDVIICADTIVYLGALEKTATGVAAALRPGGSFVASVEKLESADEDYRLALSSRFQHSAAYLERLAGENGLEMASLKEAVLRKESGEPVHGYVFEYRKPG